MTEVGLLTDRFSFSLFAHYLTDFFFLLCEENDKTQKRPDTSDVSASCR